MPLNMRHPWRVTSGLPQAEALSLVFTPGGEAPPYHVLLKNGRVLHPDQNQASHIAPTLNESSWVWSSLPLIRAVRLLSTSPPVT